MKINSFLIILLMCIPCLAFAQKNKKISTTIYLGITPQNTPNLEILTNGIGAFIHPLASIETKYQLKNNYSVGLQYEMTKSDHRVYYFNPLGQKESFQKTRDITKFFIVADKDFQLFNWKTKPSIGFGVGYAFGKPLEGLVQNNENKFHGSFSGIGTMLRFGLGDEKLKFTYELNWLPSSTHYFSTSDSFTKFNLIISLKLGYNFNW